MASTDKLITAVILLAEKIDVTEHRMRRIRPRSVTRDTLNS
jgi:hypothetical protein